ncbi:MerR family transcriptional regulator [Xylocopilactobacillus apicola]|uniref:Transcriptional regulator n=1 Tax=Xylocopilactobacillus apicola TaxID=2932184 RepID=A0AAU9CZ53_9LACO|nr:MerR family transcriptional regulator [Xylocopilactobacillus apicola]BDR59302.1 transcriptional regulator [Xylocopilactobacillus apicola]
MDNLVKVIKQLDLSIGIGEASRITGASGAQLRYWEKKGLVHPIQRIDGGNKRYDLNTLMRIILIKYYIDNGFTLSKASEIIRSRCDDGTIIRTFIMQRLNDIQNDGEMVKLHFGEIDNDPGYQMVVEVQDENVRLLRQKNKASKEEKV